MFSTTSRYQDIQTATFTTPDGRQIVYVQRRFLPTEKPTEFTKHTVTGGDRLDNITARYLGDPQQFWRLCDTNNAMHPQELTAKIAQPLVIPLS
jgi:Tol biopolymer transport system component